MAITLQQLQDLRDAKVRDIASSIERLQKGDKSVSWQSVTEKQRALQILDSEIEKATGTAPVRITRLYGREF